MSEFCTKRYLSYIFEYRASYHFRADEYKPNDYYILIMSEFGMKCYNFTRGYITLLMQVFLVCE